MASSEGQKNMPPEPVVASAAATPGYGNADWAAVQAYYSTAMTGSSPHPYVWAGQPMMSPYGTPVPFSPYHPNYYAHLPMGVSMGYTQGESEDKDKEKEGKKRSKGNSVNTPEKSKASSGSGNNSSRSSGSGSEDSSETRDDEAVLKQTSVSKKRKHANSAGESSSKAMVRHSNSTPESNYKIKPRTASKLPVSAPGRTAVATPLANLSIGMDLWNTSHTNALALNSRPVDERDLKRERRKQSNRESARRSRLRKQQECEDLGKKVAELSDENNTLKADLDQLKKACEEMEAENKQLMDDMLQSHGPGVLTTLGINTCAFNLVKCNENTKADANSNGIIVSESGNAESASR